MAIYPGAINRISAVGMEVTPGTAVAITKRFASFGLTYSPDYNIATIQLPGMKYDAKSYLSGEASSFSLDGGFLTYDEVIYPLSSIMKKVTPTTPTGATLARLWTFDSNSFARDTVQTFSVETGNVDSGRGGKSAGAVFNEFSFEATRGGDLVSMGGNLIAEAREPGALTGTGIALTDTVPVTPQHFEVYLDDTQGALGTTRLTGVFQTGFTLGDRQSQVWTFDRTKLGPTGFVEGRPSNSISLRVADETNPVDDILTDLRAGQQKFMRIEAIGPQIETGTPNQFYKLQLDACVQVSDAPDEGEEDDAAIVDFTFGLQHNGAWGKAFEVKIVNTKTAL